MLLFSGKVVLDVSNEIVDPRQMFVVKANALVQKSRFSLSLQQQKIVLYLISKIQPTDEEFKQYEFSIPDFCRVCGIDYDSGKNYSDLKAQIKEIADKSLWVEIEEDEETLLRWIERPYINKRQGIVRIKLDEYMKPFLLQLKEHYLQYQLIYTLRMKSKYSLRLYELIMSYFYNKLCSYTKTFAIDELRKLIDAEKYTRFCDFHKDVLRTAVAEINLYTDLNLTYKQISKGRKTVAIEFSFSTKDPVERLRIAEETDLQLGTNQLQLF